MEERLHLIRTADGGASWRHDRSCLGCGRGPFFLEAERAGEYATVTEAWLRAELGEAPF